MAAVSTAKVTVTPEEFHFVKYEARDIIDVVVELAELLEVSNPIHVIVDETTPLAKLAAETDGTSSDATLTLRAESGALENTQRFTHFSEEATRRSLGRTLLRARDRLRADFADAPHDLNLSLAENAAWDTYCAGRLDRLGVDMNRQRWLYNYRNRFGFSDDGDVAFDQLYSADDLSWSEVAAGTQS